MNNKTVEEIKKEIEKLKQQLKYKEDHKKYCDPECPEQDQPSNKDK